eukprot:CAMPEP_0172507170 /NCGR_PEP_ID=MMETSP1066-20121228/201915_1 /TAXON_ID=671091 /ORGANISM="Coscinodiscus wailesii, Strain CCMP2513" /LENGTH=152 /DNA_ID=CAMNT_0013284613 /DNA_START=57 /DNA_END=516 /DNA_ORIENTATION=+
MGRTNEAGETNEPSWLAEENDEKLTEGLLTEDITDKTLAVGHKKKADTTNEQHKKENEASWLSEDNDEKLTEELEQPTTEKTFEFGVPEEEEKKPLLQTREATKKSYTTPSTDTKIKAGGDDDGDDEDTDVIARSGATAYSTLSQQSPSSVI